MYTGTVVQQADKPTETLCVAVIDLGTNSFRMTIATISDSMVRPIAYSKEAVRLGQSLGGHPARLSFKGMRRAWRCLERFKEMLQSYPVTALKIVGTSALRQASNSSQWLQTAQEILGHPIEIISGDEEGRLVYELFSKQIAKSSHAQHWVMDIGGGSTEIVLGNTKGIMQIFSLDMGCVTLQKKYPLHWAMSLKGYDALVAYCIKLLEKKIPLQERRAPAWITKGIAPVVLEIAKAHGWQSTLDCCLIEKVQKQMCKDRFGLKGLDKSKRQIFPYGLAILQAVMIHLHLPTIGVSNLALEDALLLRLCAHEAPSVMIEPSR